MILDQPDPLVMPMGKYRGQHIDQIATFDPQYLQWLLLQPWFAERYPKIRDYLTQNTVGKTADDSPEHNAMQARFLDPELALRVVSMWPSKYSLEVTGIVFEQHDWDVVINYRGWDGDGDCHMWDVAAIELKPTIGDDYPAVLRQVLRRRHLRMPGIIFTRETYHRRVVIVDRAQFTPPVTWDQVVTTFGTQQINLIRFEELA